MAQSSDPDVDAVMGSYDHPEAAKDSDAASVLASFDQPPTPRSGSNVVKDLIHSKVSHGIASIGGGLREIGDLATGKSIAEADTRYKQFVNDNSYQPTDPTSQALVKVNQQAESSPYNPMTWPARALDAAGSGINKVTGSTVAGPVTVGAAEMALPFLGVRSGRAGPVSLSEAQSALDAAAAKSPQSMGAAAAAPKLGALPPELQQAVRDAVQKTGGAINPDVFTRHAEAASLPVPMRLSEGQATQDPNIISHEMNGRGRSPQTVANLDLQNKQLAENMQAIRDRVGPDVFSTNHVEHGDTLMQAYRDMDAPIKADISAKYKALEDANGGQFPLDGNAFTQSADAALAKKMKGRFLPSAIAGDLQDLRNGGPMTYETFENLRTNLAAEARKADRAGDGNAEAAVNIVRDSLESLPMTKETAAIKPLADAARAAAKSRFDAIASDPAYKAVVNETVKPDDFVRKYVIGGKRDDVATMRNHLSGNDTAVQTMGVSALDHLRDAAKIGPGGSENFAQAAFNKQLAALDPKLRSLIDPKTADQLGTLGSVARYTTNQPRGSFVNNSNTAVAMMAEHAANAAETLGNTIGGGVVPLGSMARKSIQNRAAAKQAQKAWAPGAGLTQLSDVAKQ